MQERIVGLSFMVAGLNYRTVWDLELWEWRHYAATYDEQVAEAKRLREEQARNHG